MNILTTIDVLPDFGHSAFTLELVDLLGEIRR